MDTFDPKHIYIDASKIDLMKDKKIFIKDIA